MCLLHRILFCLAVCLFCTTHASAADVIELNNGTVIEGEVIEQTERQIRIRVTMPGGGEAVMGMPRERIRRLVIKGIETILGEAEGTTAAEEAPAAEQEPEESESMTLATDRLDATVVVEALLRRQSPPPPPEAIRVYQEALGWYEWEVTRVVRGTLDADRIHVSHWLVRRNLAQPITRTPVIPEGTGQGGGRRGPRPVTLHLRPFPDVEPILQTVETSNALEGRRPRFHDVLQELQLPDAGGRWDYAVDIADKMPLLFRLKDQLRLVALGDCQAWFANRTEFFMGEENLVTPLALNLCQQRSGLPLQKTLIDHYLVHLPNLEYVVLTWHTRFVNRRWGEHGRMNSTFRSSSAFRAEQGKGAQIFADEPGGRVTVSNILTSPELSAIWSQQPWGWTGQGSASERQIRSAANEARNVGNGRERYEFDPGRWRIVEEIATTLQNRGVKLLIYTQPFHPITGGTNIKDKSGTPASAYQDQMEKLRDLERRFAGTVFFYDLNNAGNNGLEPSDFVNIDHVSREGAEKVSRRVEAWRARIAAGQR